MLQPPLRILQLFVSPGHNFYGHNGRDPSEHPTFSVAEIECVQGHGIAGDRFYDYKADYKGQVTFFSQEVYASLCSQLDVHDKSPAALRRNVLCEGVDLNTLIGEEFEVQGVAFRGREECRPCHWMDHAIGAGAEAALRGRGGLRAEVIRGGVLRLSEAAALVS